MPAAIFVVRATVSDADKRSASINGIAMSICRAQASMHARLAAIDRRFQSQLAGRDAYT